MLPLGTSQGSLLAAWVRRTRSAPGRILGADAILRMPERSDCLLLNPEGQVYLWHESRILMRAE